MAETVTLKVSEALQADVSQGRARIDTSTRMALGIEPGDIIEIVGKKSTGAKVFRVLQEDEGKGILRIDGLIRKNADVSIGEKVTVKKAELRNAAEIVMAPIVAEKHQLKFSPGIEGFIKRGLLKRLPLSAGDAFVVPGLTLGGGYISFSVISTKPKGIIQISEETKVVLREEGLSETDMAAAGISYEDIGGLKDELQRVREMIELPLKHPELFDTLGIDPPKGVLLYGPPGTGKTMIAKAVASESGASFFSIQGPEIMSKYYGQSEEKLREMFKKAQESAPSVIFLDEVDSIAPKRDDVQGEVERRVVAQLLTLMDGMSARGNVIVIAATNREDAIDPALRRPGRFDREIEIGVPDREGRKEILQVHTRGMPLDDDFDLEYLASITHGFVGADLAALGREAAMKALRRYLPDIDLDEAVPAEILEKMKVIDEDFREALKEIEPSSLREVLVEVPRTTWDDVGGLDDVKVQLKESVEMPLNDPKAFEEMGISAPTGVLLYGPPGTGKTLLAKAVAHESNSNFISIKGPEVLSKWVGESEKAVRMIFKRAKQASPCIIFLDELDSIAPSRGSGDSRATERVVNQLLTSMDGLEDLENVVVLAATNRPDIIDAALLRPGRFDRHIMIPAPSKDGRRKIFDVHTMNMPLVDVDLDKLASATEGYVGADIEGLCREAAMLALRDDINSRKVLWKHFEKALENTGPSVTEDLLKHYENIGKTMDKSKLGRKEAGGALDKMYS